MKRLCGLLLSVAVVAGCQSTAQEQADAHHEMDDTSIAEAPMPTIEPKTYIAAGDLAATRNEFAMAATQYSNALKVQPNDPKTLKKLALAYVKGNQMPAAIETWQKYLKATDGSSDAYGSLGFAYELNGNPKAAEQTYLEGIAKHPDGALVRENYGLMLVRQNHVDEAVKQMSAVLKPYEVNYNIAGVYQQLGRRDLAKFYYSRSLECNPNFYAAKERLTALDTN